MSRPSPSKRGPRGAALARWAMLALLLSPLAAVAGEYGLKLEPGFAFPLTAPQSERFDWGGGGAAKLLFGMGSMLDLTAGVTYVGLPRASGSTATEAGMAWGFGPGLRLMMPRYADERARMSPWVDGDALYVRTGKLNRFGFAAAAGLAFPVDRGGNLWLGPYVRYQQIFGRGEGLVDGRDAKLLLAGLSLEVGSHARRRAEVATPQPVPVQPAAPRPAPPTDRDGDGTFDPDDLCVDVAGPASNRGCPVYEKVVVKPDKLELKEKIQFEWNSPTIETVSYATLDEVVKALQDNRGFRVQLEGHASSEGTGDHNQVLSEQRAQAVLDYLAGHGVARDRLSSKGFASSVPTQSNTTAAGREANRRVEFVVHFIILDSGSRP